MLLSEKFRSYFTGQFSPVPGKKFLLAVSGGMDSMVLWHLCREAGFSYSVVHCNFGLRGPESERDEEFVTQQAREWNTEIFLRKFETQKYVADKNLSVQEAARSLRYQWFKELMDTGPFTYTLLAHHANDNIETVLMNFLRGTGLEGLTGMKSPSPLGNFLRPMLFIRRSEIEQYAAANHLKWVEDSSNHSSKYTRNFFRNEVLPLLRKIYPMVDDNILQNIERFKSIQTFYLESISAAKHNLVVYDKGEAKIPVRKMQKAFSSALVYEILKDYGFGEKAVGEFVKLMDSSTGKYFENDSYQVIRHREWILIAPKTGSADIIAINKDDSCILFNGGILQFEKNTGGNYEINTSTQTAQLDTRLIEYPLLLRKWKAGDYFYPLGMRKKKKLARFLIDQKVPKHKKENTWVLESNNKILWVVGHRIDDRFKLTPATASLLVITYQHEV